MRNWSSDGGLIHVRVPTLCPWPIQVAVNGHDYLARQLLAAGIGFVQEDNAFVELDDPARAQKLADRFLRENWPGRLRRLAREWANRCASRNGHGFLGRRLHVRYDGQVLSDCKTDRVPGWRIKHRVRNNWIKMYDKRGRVLRVETVINNPREFEVRRRCLRGGKQVMAWTAMNKGACNLYRYQQVCRGANGRYLAAPAPLHMPIARSAAGGGAERPASAGRTAARSPSLHRPSGPKGRLTPQNFSARRAEVTASESKHAWAPFQRPAVGPGNIPEHARRSMSPGSAATNAIADLHSRKISCLPSCEGQTRNLESTYQFRQRVRAQACPQVQGWSGRHPAGLLSESMSRSRTQGSVA